MEVMGWLTVSWEIILRRKTGASKAIPDSFRPIEGKKVAIEESLYHGRIDPDQSEAQWERCLRSLFGGQQIACLSGTK
jgi:hypothetical protein